MDKIIGMGNALVDVLATLNDDHILTEMELPKGSMTLIDETKLLIINECFSEMETELATGGSAGNAIRGMACLVREQDSLVRLVMMLMENFIGKVCWNGERKQIY